MTSRDIVKVWVPSQVPKNKPWPSCDVIGEQRAVALDVVGVLAVPAPSAAAVGGPRPVAPFVTTTHQEGAVQLDVAGV